MPEATSLGAADGTDSKDAEFLDNMQAQRRQHFNTIDKIPTAPESAYKSACLECAKGPATVLKDMKAYRRKVARRAESPAKSLSLQNIDDFMSSIDDFVSLMRMLAQVLLEADDAMKLYKKLIPVGLLLDESCYFRLCRGLVHTDMKWNNWKNLLGSTYKFMSTNITKSDVDQFSLKCILQVFAKSIQNVPVEKASWHSIWLHSFILLVISVG